MAIWTDQLSVTTGAAVALAEIPVGQKATIVVTQPNTTNTLYIGGSGVLPTNGVAVGGPAATGGPIDRTITNFTGTLYGIALTGTVTVQVMILTVDG